MNKKTIINVLIILSFILICGCDKKVDGTKKFIDSKIIDDVTEKNDVTEKENVTEKEIVDGIRDEYEGHSVQIPESQNDDKNDDIDFYSDNTKYVFEFTNTRYVYYYSGDKITSYVTYVDYDNYNTAKTIAASVKLEDYPEAKKIYQKGKYIIFEWKESEYEDLKPSELEATMSYMKMLKKGDN